MGNTSKTYIVTFKDTESETGLKFTSYLVRVRASDLEDAQQKAIDSLESINMKHGSISSITRSCSSL